MKKLSLLSLLLFVMAFAVEASSWNLGVQAYTFRKYTLAETLEKSKALGLHSIELYPGQKLGGGLKGSTSYKMDAETRKAVKKMLRQAGIRVLAYGCCTPGGEADWRALFTFAKEMKIPVICSEPAPQQFDLIESLAEEFKIKIAIHNHATPSRYWNPETIAKACKGRSPLLGACVDTGHWTRSGLDPLTCLKLLSGRIHNVHLKDMNGNNKASHCVPFGTGVCNLPLLLAELKLQEYNGLFAIEYEHNSSRPYPDVKQCVDWFEKASALPVEDLLRGKTPKGSYTDNIDKLQARPEPGESGQWPKIESASTEGYRDQTDGVKGILQASDQGFPKEQFPNAFDNDPKKKWCVKKEKVWLQFGFPDGRQAKIDAYTITTANDASSRDPKAWRLLGSNDGGKNWAEIDSRSNMKWYRRFQKKLFKLAKPAEFNLYRLDIHQNCGADTSQLGEVELLVKKDQ